MGSPTRYDENPLPRSPRYESLDLWRCVACLAVVAFHSTAICYESSRSSDLPGLIVALTARGWMGVPIFFVISGYCISATIDAAKFKDRRGRTYFLRRFRRIYPPFWACVGLTAVFWTILAALGQGHLITGTFGSVPMVPDFTRLTARQWGGNLALAEMWRHNFDGVPGVMMLGQTWTLCYEVQFYAAAGLLLVLAPRRIFPAAALLSLAVLACGPLGLDWRGMMWDGRWILFATGIAVYYAINYADARGRRLILAGLAAGTAYGLARRLNLLPEMWSYPALNRSEAFVAFSFAVAMMLLHPHDKTLCSWRILRPLLFLGRSSYSIYLVHLPIVFAIAHALFLGGLKTPAPTILITVPICMAAAILCGWLFYATIERRFISYRKESPSLATAPKRNLKSQISNLRSQISNLRPHL